MTKKELIATMAHIGDDDTIMLEYDGMYEDIHRGVCSVVVDRVNDDGRHGLHALSSDYVEQAAKRGESLDLIKIHVLS